MPRSATALIRLLPAPDAAPADAPLLRAFLSSAPAASETAFAELVRRHGPMVLAACRRVLCNSHDAEDAFQGTFLVLARKAGTIHGNLAAWLYAVAVRTARGVRVMRDRRRKHEMRAAANGLKAPANGVGAIGDPELASVVDEEIAKLPEHYREAIVLCELRGLSRKQAATELGIPEGTLSSRLAGGKRRLATLLSARGLAAPAALVSLVAPADVSAALFRAAVSATRGTVSTAASSAAGAVMKAMLFDQLKAVVVTAGIMMTVACGGWAMTSAPGGDHPAPAPRATQDPAALLIAQLGAPDFADREAAQKALRVLGFQAESAIKAGLKSESAETRDRCAKLLNEIRADARDALVKGFNTSSTDEYDHPLWKRFSAIAGKTRASRELFVRIIRNPNWLRRLDAADANPATAAQHYREAIMEVGKLFNYYLTVSFHVPLWPCDRGEEVAYLLLLGSYPNSAPDLSVLLPKDARQFATGEGRIPLARGLELGLQGKLLETFPQFRPDPVKAIDGTDRVFARLLSAWLPQRRNPDVLWGAFRLAAAHGASDVLPFARRAAADRSLPVDARCYALMPIARFSNSADRKLFEALFADETVIAVHDGLDFRSVAPPGSKPVKAIGHVQARDYAAAHLLLLFGENPSDYGFIQARNRRAKAGERLNPAEYLITEFAFPTDDDNKSRLSAHAKVKAFLDKHSKDEPKKDEPDAAKLVEQLGASEFAEREAAQKALRLLGPKAETALKAGLMSENAEIANRCRELLDQLTWAEFEARHWPRFAKVVGDGKEDRELFARIRSLKRNVELLNAVVADPDSAGKLYHDRWKELNTAARTPNGPGGYILSAASLADVVGWMYLGTFPGAEGSFHQSFSLDFLPTSFYRNSRDPLPVALKDKTASAALRRLVGKWTAARTDYSGRDFGLQLALAYDITEVLPAARGTLKAKVKDDPYPGNTARNVGWAMLVVGKLGTKDDLPYLEAYAKDETRCATFLHDPPTKPGAPKFRLPRPPIEGQDTTTQLRDVSAAMRLHFCGYKPHEFGFYWKWPFGDEAGKQNSLGAFNLYAIGFLRDADRTAAHKKAGEWLVKQEEKLPVQGAKVWPHFKKVVGDDKSSRELFALIVKNAKNLEVLEKAAAGNADLLKLYSARREELNKASYEQDPNDPSRGRLVPIPLDDAAGWLLLGTYPDTKGKESEPHAPQFLWRYDDSFPLNAAILKGPLSVPLRKLFAAWLANRGEEPEALKSGFDYALGYEIPGALETARRLLKAPIPKAIPKTKQGEPTEPVQYTYQTLGYCIVIVGKYGTKDDIALVAPFLDDTHRTGDSIFDNPKRDEFWTTEMRDVAVGTMIELKGGVIDDFGFLIDARKEGVRILDPFYVDHIGFHSDEARKAAHKKAREWLAKQK